MTNKESANEISKAERYLINKIKSLNEKALKTKLEKIEAEKKGVSFYFGDYIIIVGIMLGFLYFGLVICDNITK